MDARSFFREVGRRFDCGEEGAEAVTFVVFEELRDRLTPKEVADVAAQLPGGLRGLWGDVTRAGRAVSRIHAIEFVAHVRNRLALTSDSDAKRAIRAVFGTLQLALGSPTGIEGESWDVFSQLPKDMKPLWLDAASPRLR